MSNIKYQKTDKKDFVNVIQNRYIIKISKKDVARTFQLKIENEITKKYCDEYLRIFTTYCFYDEDKDNFKFMAVNNLQTNNKKTDKFYKFVDNLMNEFRFKFNYEETDSWIKTICFDFENLIEPISIQVDKTNEKTIIYVSSWDRCTGYEYKNISIDDSNIKHFENILKEIALALTNCKIYCSFTIKKITDTGYECTVKELIDSLVGTQVYTEIFDSYNKQLIENLFKELNLNIEYWHNDSFWFTITDNDKKG